MAPPISPAGGARTVDWATASIVLSVGGAALSLLAPGLFWGGVVMFVVGLVAGVVALRKGLRRNRAIVGIVLNAANLLFDAAIVIFGTSR